MSRIRKSRWAGIAPIACLAMSSIFAQATRTWVSGVGDDANPCSRTAPCKTFAGAISKTAPAGEIDVLDPGGFGALTITKSISIEADGLIAGILVSGTNGFTINAGPTDVVVLRGLTFEGLGTGIDGVQIVAAGSVIIENCYFRGFAHRGISVEPTGSSGNPTNVRISNSQIRGNQNNGIAITPAAGILAQVNIDHTNITENSSFGLTAQGVSSTVVRDSTIANNSIGKTFANVSADGSAGGLIVNLDTTTVSGAPTGITSTNGATIRVNNSTIVGNVVGISTSGGGTVVSYGNNRLTNGAFSSLTGLQ